VWEEDSSEAIAILDAAGDPLIFSHLHAVEIPNAIRLKRFRGEITKAEEAAAIRVYQSDIDAGRLLRPDYDLADMFIQAEQLSAKYSGEMGSRSLDVLHVATALQCGCESLASFDERQRKVAIRAGLKVIPAKRKKA
jgi:predicted nucleic acid-binding protein